MSELHEKRCGHCKETKSVDAFSKDRYRPDGYKTTCNSCNAVYTKRWRSANHEKYRLLQRDSASKSYKAIMRILAYIKTNVPCTDCDIRGNPIYMEFDHRDPSTKRALVSSLNGSLTNLAAELEKCDVVCANCHTVRTAKRRNEVGNDLDRESVTASIPTTESLR